MWMKMSETLPSDEHSEEVDSNGDINYTSDGANNDIKVTIFISQGL